jgi:hypothetical protein
LKSLRGDGIRDLRALLKRLLRPHQWKCVSIQQEQPIPPTEGSRP